MDKCKVLFVCLGNICRSPTAHGVFEGMVRKANLQDVIEVDSCGTGDWHIGHQPDRRASEEAIRRGYDLSQLRARQVVAEDFEQFDYILPMDNQNMSDLSRMCPATYSGKLSLFLDYAEGAKESEVPDPYYGGDDGFAHVFDLVESASSGLLQEICGEYSPK